MSFLRVVFMLLATGGGLFFSGTSSLASDVPDVILIIGDDLGVELGCYGYPGIETPQIDRIAAEGARFTRAYCTQASCSPSRSSIFTGYYPHQTGQVGLSNEGFRERDGLVFLPDYFHSAGYRTGLVGKVHVAPEEPIKFDWEVMRGDPKGTSDVVAVAKAVEGFVKETPQSQPLFLMLNYFDPHRHDDVPGGFIQQVDGLPKQPLEAQQTPPLPFLIFDTPALRTQTAGYLDSVLRLDAGLGLIRDVMSASGRKPPLIIVLGDQGAPFARSKPTCYEAGVHIPLLISYPGKIPAGTVCNELVSTIDIVPTVLEMLKLKGPGNLPGLSLWPLLDARPDVPWRTHLVTEFYAHARQHKYPKRSMRDERYKLIANTDFENENPLRTSEDSSIAFWEKHKPMGVPIDAAYENLLHPPAFELYDLALDPFETRNLAVEPRYRPQLESLHAALLAWQKETKDDLALPPLPPVPMP